MHTLGNDVFYYIEDVCMREYMTFMSIMTLSSQTWPIYMRMYRKYKNTPTLALDSILLHLALIKTMHFYTLRVIACMFTQGYHNTS